MRTVSGQMSRPVVAEAGQTEAVSARYGHRVSKDVSTQGTQKVLLGKETDGRSHYLQMSIE